MLVTHLLPPLPLFRTTQEIDSAIFSLTHTILDALDLTAPTARQYMPLPPLQSFLAPVVKILIGYKRYIQNHWLRHRSPFLKSYLNLLTKIMRKRLAFVHAQKIHFQTQTANPSDYTLWNITRLLLRKPTKLPTLVIPTGEASSPSDKCDMLGNYFASTFTSHPSHNWQHDNNIQEVNARPEITVPECPKYISSAEIIKYISLETPKLSFGHDLKSTFLLKRLPSKVIVHVTAIFNAALKQTYFPDKWKLNHIIPILKPGKVQNDPISYRPISLLPIMGKLFEKCVLSRLNSYLSSDNAIPPHQFGFRPILSTYHQILRLTEDIIEGFHDH